MPSLPELGSHLPIPLLVPSKRQLPEPDVNTGNAGPVKTATAPVSISYTATIVPTATTATYSAVNSHSLVMASTVQPGTNAKSATPTLGTTASGSTDDQSNGQSTVEKLFTPAGGLFAVGIVIIGLAVLTLLTCAIVTIRCTLRNRRRSRTRSRAQSFTEKNVPRRKISSDRASEFWSAGANEPTRRWTRWGDVPAGGTDPQKDGQRPPTRPVRSGETEVDLRAPGRVHFTPSVAMSDYTGLSVDAQPHGSARSSGANMDTIMANSVSTNSEAALPKPVVAGPTNRHLSTATKFTTYTLDQDPFAASPIMPMPNTAKPLLSPAHAMTFPPYTPNTPHTSGNPFADSSPQFAANFSSSPSNIATLGSSSSGTIGHGSSLGSSNILGLTSSPSSTPYVLAETTTALQTPTSGVMYKSGVDSLILDPFAYDTGVRSRASTLGGTPHMDSFPSPGVTWTNVNLGVASPPALHIERTSPGIQASPLSSYLSSPSPRSDSHLASPAPTFQTFQPSVISLTPPQPPLPVLQSDVTQVLTSLRRRMSDSTMATRLSQQTDYQYRPTLGAISDNDERSSSFFMYNSPGSPSRPVSLPFVPRLRVSTPAEPEMHQMQPTRTGSAAAQDASSVYSSPVSMVDGYHQGSGAHSELRFGSGTQAASTSVGYGSASGLGLSISGSGPGGPPAPSNSVRTSVLSFYDKNSNA